ncbi:hypothetical protein Hanom_Chr12g01147741 [Helianthus anomalus]
MEKGVKRKFTWFLHEWAGNRDGLNAREADGTLKPLKEYNGPLEDNGHQIAPDTIVFDKIYMVQQYVHL